MNNRQNYKSEMDVNSNISNGFLKKNIADVYYKMYASRLAYFSVPSFLKDNIYLQKM